MAEAGLCLGLTSVTHYGHDAPGASLIGGVHVIGAARVAHAPRGRPVHPSSNRAEGNRPGACAQMGFGFRASAAYRSCGIHDRRPSLPAVVEPDNASGARWSRTLESAHRVCRQQKPFTARPLAVTIPARRELALAG